MTRTETGYRDDREAPEPTDAKILVGRRKTDSAMQSRCSVSSAMAMSHFPAFFLFSLLFRPPRRLVDKPEQ